jgi:hypothetical protein
MICQTQSKLNSTAEKIFDEVLHEIASGQFTLELVTDPAEEAWWNKLIRKHHCLKEHRMVGESLQLFSALDTQTKLL